MTDTPRNAEVTDTLDAAAMALPFVSVIIPCLDERERIEACLNSVLASEYPASRMEIIVVDGMSADGTREILAKYAERHPRVRVLDNPRRITPVSLNIAVRASKGDVIVRMDGHTHYRADYIPKCVEWLLKGKADVVGGIIVTDKAAPTLLAEAIAGGMSSPFGVGNAYFRIGAQQPRYVDTVPFGCYRRETLEKAGLFDEDLPTSQDEEFNTRVIQLGGKILLVPEIVSHYYARENLSDLAAQYFRYGSFKPKVIRRLGTVATWRQMVPPSFVFVLAVCALAGFWFSAAWVVGAAVLAAYAAFNLGASFLVASDHGWRVIGWMPLVFATLHFCYGLGFLKGCLEVALTPIQATPNAEAVPAQDSGLKPGTAKPKTESKIS